MKIITFAILIVSTILVSAAFNFIINNIQWGTKTLYQPLQTVYTTPPNGYKAVYINHVGRHGARHISGIDEISSLFLALKTAQLENSLTQDGKNLLKMDSLLIIIEKGNVGLISEIGKEEQESIGARMAKNYPEVFKLGNIRISTTNKERTKQSARAFIQGLKPNENVMVDSINIDQTHLAFYDIAPSYNKYKDNGIWKSHWAKILNSEKVVQMRQELPGQFFTPAFIKKMNSGQIQIISNQDTIKYTSASFIEGFYSGCSIIPSIGKEIKKAGFQTHEIDFAFLISVEDLEALNSLNTAEDFLLKGPATDANGIQIRIAAPLLSDFITSTENFISTRKINADLRFAHAETISPFAALLSINGACEPVSEENIPDFNKIWKCENIIPLSANIQWILYENKTKSDFLVKFLLNEKEVSINGLQNCETRFYYKWSDVKEYYLLKLSEMGSHLDDDMHEYLMNVR